MTGRRRWQVGHRPPTPDCLALCAHARGSRPPCAIAGVEQPSTSDACSATALPPGSADSDGAASSTSSSSEVESGDGTIKIDLQHPRRSLQVTFTCNACSEPWGCIGWWQSCCRQTSRGLNHLSRVPRPCLVQCLIASCPSPASACRRPHRAPCQPRGLAQGTGHSTVRRVPGVAQTGRRRKFGGRDSVC